MDAAAHLVDGENSARCKRGTADCVPTAAGITPDDTGPDVTAKSGTGSVEPNYKLLVDLVYLICSMPPEIYEAPENDRLGENPACNCHSPPATHRVHSLAPQRAHLGTVSVAAPEHVTDASMRQTIGKNEKVTHPPTYTCPTLCLLPPATGAG